MKLVKWYYDNDSQCRFFKAFDFVYMHEYLLLKDACIKEFTNNFDEILYILSGECTVKYGDDPKRINTLTTKEMDIILETFYLNKGDILRFEGCEFWKLDASTDCKFLLIKIKND